MARVSRGQRRHIVTLRNPDGPAVSDGDGGFTHEYVDLVPPRRYAEIKPATVRDLERLAAGTVLSTESLLITMDFHPLVTTATQLAWVDPAGRSHTASVTGVNNPEQRCIDLILLAVELVP